MACLALVLPACGDDDDDDGGSAENTQQPAETSTKAPAAQAPEITMKGRAFAPFELNVKSGTTVTWTNEESVGHDVQKSGGPGPDFSSGGKGAMKQGDTFKLKFTKPGIHDYFCSVHGDVDNDEMVGRVVVQ